MSMSGSAQPAQQTSNEPLSLARQVILDESNALRQLANSLPSPFEDAVKTIAECRGAIIVTGIGKAGWIGQKLSASFASTGTRSHFLHSSEAFHGDLGRIAADDVVLVLSNSGETEEVLRLLPTLKILQVPVIAMTARTDNSLSRQADIVLDYGQADEACPLGLAPSTTTTMMLALGDALTLVVSNIRSFTAQDFALFHPGGSLGLKLSSVEQVMRPISECRIAEETKSVRKIYIESNNPSRRSGAILVVNQSNQLTGIFTDSDLARLLENQMDHQFDAPMSDVMTSDPVTIHQGAKTTDAVALMGDRNISELPVIDAQRHPIGMIDITDVVSLQSPPTSIATREHELKIVTPDG